MKQPKPMLLRQYWGSRTTTLTYKLNLNILESIPIEGDRPVGVRCMLSSSILSSAGHEKPCMNQPGPSGKAKYY